MRKSARAKRITVQICPAEGLQVIVPLRHQPDAIDSILQEKRQWIEKNLNQMSAIILRRASEPKIPASLDLPAIQKHYRIEYIKNSSKILKLKESKIFAVDGIKRILTLIGPVDDHAYVIRVIFRFLKQVAIQHLIPQIQALSIECALPYQAIGIRRQTTLWGSCNSKHKIHLNTKLLFLPEELVRYVMIHELCHTKHLNHSMRFWHLLSKFDPFYANHKRALAKAQHTLPAWLEHH